MNDTKTTIIVGLFAWIPYTAVAWGYAALTDGGTKTFWYALGALLAARVFFSIIETLGSILMWRAYGKRLMVKKNLATLRAYNFPKRQFSHDDFTGYLARIINDDSDYSAEIRKAAKDWELVLEAHESHGVLPGARMHSATDAALDLYSPRSKAPVFGAPRPNPSSL